MGRVKSPPCRPPGPPAPASLEGRDPAFELLGLELEVGGLVLELGDGLGLFGGRDGRLFGSPPLALSALIASSRMRRVLPPKSVISRASRASSTGRAFFTLSWRAAFQA